MKRQGGVQAVGKSLGDGDGGLGGWRGGSDPEGSFHPCLGLWTFSQEFGL